MRRILSLMTPSHVTDLGALRAHLGEIVGPLALPGEISGRTGADRGEVGEYMWALRQK
jgi:hypothetical protein